MKLVDYIPSLKNTNVALLYFIGNKLHNKIVKKIDIMGIDEGFMDMEVNDITICAEDDCIEIWLM